MILLLLPVLLLLLFPVVALAILFGAIHPLTILVAVLAAVLAYHYARTQTNKP